MDFSCPKHPDKYKHIYRRQPNSKHQSMCFIPELLYIFNILAICTKPYNSKFLPFGIQNSQRDLVKISEFWRLAKNQRRWPLPIRRYKIGPSTGRKIISNIHINLLLPLKLPLRQSINAQNHKITGITNRMRISRPPSAPRKSKFDISITFNVKNIAKYKKFCLTK
jgi:hypothetical protein